MHTQHAESKLWAVLLTYNRPADLRDHLAALRSQVRRPDHLVVVDNGDLDGETATIVAAHRDLGQDVSLVQTGENLGPAGGWALGVRGVLKRAAPADWLLLLDDNDPPRTDGVLRDIEALARRSHALDPHVGGAGLIGARFDRHRGVVTRLRDNELSGTVDVDTFGGGTFPLYRIEALQAVGGLRADLFFGFEDLDLGLRLRECGYRLVIDGPLMEAERRHAGNLGLPAVRRTRPGDASPWRRYYTVRNVILICRELGFRRAAILSTLRAGIAGPLVAAIRRDPQWRELGRMSVKGAADAWRGRTGAVVAPGLSGLK